MNMTIEQCNLLLELKRNFELLGITLYNMRMVSEQTIRYHCEEKDGKRYTVGEICNFAKDFVFEVPCAFSVKRKSEYDLTLGFEFVEADAYFVLEFNNDANTVFITCNYIVGKVTKVTLQALTAMLVEHKPFKMQVDGDTSALIQKIAYANDTGGWLVNDGVLREIMHENLPYLYYHKDGHFSVSIYSQDFFDKHHFDEVMLGQEDWRNCIPEGGVLCWTPDGATPFVVTGYDILHKYSCKDGVTRQYATPFTQEELQHYAQVSPSIHKVSKEILSHYNCTKCKGWWSIGDHKKNHPLYCPHCGTLAKSGE